MTSGSQSAIKEAMLRVSQQKTPPKNKNASLYYFGASNVYFCKFIPFCPLPSRVSRAHFLSARSSTPLVVMKFPRIIAAVLVATMLVGSNGFYDLEDDKIMVPKGVEKEITMDWLKVGNMSALGPGKLRQYWPGNIGCPLLVCLNRGGSAPRFCL